MRTKEKHSRVLISLNGDVYPADEAGILLNRPTSVLINMTNKTPEFILSGVHVKRVSAVFHRRGTLIRCASTGKEWPTIKSFAADFGLKANTVENAIRTNQRFEYNGQTYFAPFYKEIHHIHTKPKETYDDKIVLTEKPVLESLKVDPPAEPVNVEKVLHEQVENKIKALTTEQQCFEIMQKLAIERIRNTQYDKASKVLDALTLLSN